MAHQIIISLLFLILTCYLGARIIYSLPISRTGKWLLFFFCLLASENFLLHRLFYAAGILPFIPPWLSLGLSIAQAFIIILALLTLAREFVFIACSGIRYLKKGWRLKHEPGIWQRHLGWTSLLLCVLALLLTGKGVYNAAQIPQIVEVKITSPHLPPALEGFKIAQLSDLHISAGIDVSWVQKIVERTNALEPDLITLTGDMLDGRAMDMQAELAPLNALHAPYGVFVVDGNHEYYISYSDWLRYMDTISKHQLLRNQGVVLPVNGTRLGIAGAADRQGGKKWGGPDLDAAALAVAGADYRILLWHRPKQAELAARAGFDLMLAGHTHGGQFFPGTLLTAIPSNP